MVAYQKCDDGDVSSCLTMSCDDTALDITESLCTLKAFATKAKHKLKSPILCVKLPEELATSDLCSSIIKDLVWVMVGRLAHRSGFQCELRSDSEADEINSRHQYNSIAWPSHNSLTQSET